MYLLDTNACIRILNGTSPSLIDHLRAVPRSLVRLSSVVKAELLYGARKSTRIAENLRLLERFFDTIATLPFDDRCAEEYGLLREELDRAGTPIELLAKQAILLCAAVVERKSGDRIEESLQQAQVLSDARAFPGAVEKLGFDDRGEL